MARPRTFDLEQVQDAAMQTFWCKGYKGTSLSDLCEAMDIKKGSFYKAFGDKHQFFLDVLGMYLDEMQRQQFEILDNGTSPKDAISNWLHGSVAFAKEDNCKGCLAMNVALERGGEDKQIKHLLMFHLEEMIKKLSSIIAIGQKDGEFRNDIEPKELAMIVQGQVFGVLTMIKGSHGAIELEPMIDAVMKILE